MTYNVDTIAAASRVGRTFETGCDRCSHDDLALLEENNLMTSFIAKEADIEFQDSLEVGDLMFEFNVDGEKLVAAILQNADEDTK